MKNRDARGVFEVDRFIADVEHYRVMHGISRRELVAAAHLSTSTALGVLRHENGLTLLSAVSFADVCDLSLDNYRKRWM